MLCIYLTLCFPVSLGFVCLWLMVTAQKTLVVLELLIKRCNNILLCVIWLDRKYCKWNCARLEPIHQIHFYIENIIRLVLFVVFLWPLKPKLTSDFFIFLFMVTSRGIIFVCSGVNRIFICTILLQLFATLRIITAASTVVAFCSQGHFWAGLISPKIFLSIA